ncbi:MAG: glycosyltransferase family 2 protein [Bacteroidota bacterium]
MNNPKLTVLMPAYNAQQYIAEAIKSVLTQSFNNFELLIINDGSTDKTLAIINTFDDKRIRIINQENKGIAAALNTGLSAANTIYIARFDADDICYPDRLQVQYDFMVANPDYSVIGSAADYVDVAKNYVFTHLPLAFSNSEIRQLDFRSCPFIHSSVFYKREIILGYGGYNEYAYTFEDHLLWVNLLRKEKVCNLERSLIKVRLNPESITIDEKWRTPQFRKIKYKALQEFTISRANGLKLLAIIKSQHAVRIKEGAYYALLGKKYLWNNYQPKKARENLIKSLVISPYHFKNFLLFILSFLPKKMLHLSYHTFKNNVNPNSSR